MGDSRADHDRAAEPISARDYVSEDRGDCLDVFDTNMPDFFAPDERGEFDSFLERLRKGEGVEEDTLLEDGASHILRLRGFRPSGRLRLELDGRALREVPVSSPGRISPVLEIRSWDRIRLRRAVLEVGR